MIQGRTGYFAHLTLGVGFKVISKFELTTEGQKHMKMMLS